MQDMDGPLNQALPSSNQFINPILGSISEQFKAKVN
jgi:hypothetical protein